MAGDGEKKTGSEGELDAQGNPVASAAAQAPGTASPQPESGSGDKDPTLSRSARDPLEEDVVEKYLNEFLQNPQPEVAVVANAAQTSPKMSLKEFDEFLDTQSTVSTPAGQPSADIDKFFGAQNTGSTPADHSEATASQASGVASKKPATVASPGGAAQQVGSEAAESLAEGKDPTPTDPALKDQNQNYKIKLTEARKLFNEYLRSNSIFGDDNKRREAQNAVDELKSNNVDVKELQQELNEAANYFESEKKLSQKYEGLTKDLSDKHPLKVKYQEALLFGGFKHVEEYETSNKYKEDYKKHLETQRKNLKDPEDINLSHEYEELTENLSEDHPLKVRYEEALSHQKPLKEVKAYEESKAYKQDWVKHLNAKTEALKLLFNKYKMLTEDYKSLAKNSKDINLCKEEIKVVRDDLRKKKVDLEKDIEHTRGMPVEPVERKPVGVETQPDFNKESKSSFLSTFKTSILANIAISIAEGAVSIVKQTYQLVKNTILSITTSDKGKESPYATDVVVGTVVDPATKSKENDVVVGTVVGIPVGVEEQLQSKSGKEKEAVPIKQQLARDGDYVATAAHPEVLSGSKDADSSTKREQFQLPTTTDKLGSISPVSTPHHTDSGSKGR